MLRYRWKFTRRILLNILIGVLIIIYCVFLQIQNSSLKDINKELVESKIELNYKKNNIIQNSKLQILTNDLVIDTSTILYDKDWKSFTFADFKSKTPYLILRYSSKMCGTCIDYIIEQLKLIDLPAENLIILTDFNNLGSLNAFSQSIELKNSKILSCTKPVMSFSLLSFKIPPLFILVDDKVKCLFILDEKTDNYNKLLLSLIKKKYF